MSSGPGQKAPEYVAAMTFSPSRQFSGLSARALRRINCFPFLSLLRRWHTCPCRSEERLHNWNEPPLGVRVLFFLLFSFSFLFSLMKTITAGNIQTLKSPENQVFPQHWEACSVETEMVVLLVSFCKEFFKNTNEIAIISREGRAHAAGTLLSPHSHSQGVRW